MRYVLFLLFLPITTPATADTITWFTAGQVNFVSRFADNVVGPGLTAGTPWSLTVSFNPAAPPVRTIFPGCNQYAIGASTFTLGPYSYANPGGAIYTNAGLPEVGCNGLLPEGEAGLIQFWYGTAGWQSTDPNAWRLGAWGGVMFAGYYDLFATDGTLPVVPTFNPARSYYAGMEIENNQFLGTLLGGGIPRFQLVDPPQPAAVPEPATMTLFGAGLAAALAARRRRRL
jgi:hypothetical protein